MAAKQDHGIFISELKPKMFMHWRVPGRLTGEEEQKPEVEKIPSKPSTAEKKPKSPEKPKSTPKATKCRTPMDAITELPNITEKPNSGRSVHSKPGSPSKSAPQKPASPVKPASPLRINKKAKSIEQEKIELVRQVVHPSMQDSAIKMLKDSSSSERRVIERALVAAYLGEKVDPKLSKSLRPDAKKNVEKWLENATDEERKIAIDFFGSMHTRNFETLPHDERRQKLQEVIDTLERRRTGPSTLQRQPSIGKDDINVKLKHVRMLTPNTRNNKWMHSTWHHLPPNKDDNPVFNESSIATDPHKPIQRHFTIHPDWGV